MEKNQDYTKSYNIKKQMMLYFTFALAMIILNYIIQKTNQLYLAPNICENFRDVQIIKFYYCSTNPYNMPELIGSILAVGITYIVKFILDKFIVFKKTVLRLKETSEEFFKYLGFAIITTVENIGIQFLLTNFIKTPLEISMVVALSIGYFTKFLLDRRYVFTTPY
ncbi:MAG: GtrA family protein [Promethearchaeota archaeon]|nr:MAG: GtrA family protein [Candidatus Lokiarchaeota archaeon]